MSDVVGLEKAWPPRRALKVWPGNLGMIDHDLNGTCNEAGAGEIADD